MVYLVRKPTTDNKYQIWYRASVFSQLQDLELVYRYVSWFMRCRDSYICQWASSSSSSWSNFSCRRLGGCVRAKEEKSLGTWFSHKFYTKVIASDPFHPMIRLISYYQPSFGDKTHTRCQYHEKRGSSPGPGVSLVHTQEGLVASAACFELRGIKRAWTSFGLLQHHL